MKSRDANADADERLRRRIAAAVALLLNLAFLVALDQVMRPLARERTPWVRVEPADVLQVRLIEAPPPAASPPEVPPVSEPAAVPAPAETPVERSRRLRSTARPASDAGTAPPAPRREPAQATVSTVSTPSTRADSSTAPQFYERDGQVRLPDAKAAQGETPFPHLPIVPTQGNPFVHTNPVPYEPTRFDKYFPDVRETLGGELVRKATVKRSGRLPWGTYVECTWVLFFGGCFWGTPPSATIEELKAMRADPPMPKSKSPPAAVGPPAQ
ncbi:hypothetical protein [Dokdonella sp.]|uniref:hypothetical protein n=1 Tax=Dokdonella sp. TaxID=2291710 RepID=UPI001B2A356E|nr:hypothetical protein [Dokdonella sp.]MBO9663799.1 hypothetical protein [Dokdonella sp.]